MKSQVPYAYWKDELYKDTSRVTEDRMVINMFICLLSRTMDHPVVDGLPNRWLHVTDELYDRMRGPANIDEVFFTAYSDPENRWLRP